MEETLNISTKLRLLRTSRNWSQEFVADKVGLTQASYAKLEAGKTQLTIGRIQQLADLYDVEADYFFSDISNANYFNGSHSRLITNTHTYNEASKELYDKLLSEKDHQINLLKDELKASRIEKERLSKLLELLSSKLQ